MLRQHRRLDDDDDDDSPFDARGVIKDGRSLRVPLFAMDSMDPVQRAIAQSRITDAAGTTVGLHRPGFRVTDTKDARAAVEEAYRLRDEDDRNAWRTGALAAAGAPGVAVVFVSQAICFLDRGACVLRVSDAETWPMQADRGAGGVGDAALRDRALHGVHTVHGKKWDPQ